MSIIVRIIHKVSQYSFYGAQLASVILVGAMIYEVIARYVFNAPTIWSFDVSYMGSAALFVLGMGWVLKEDGHIRIDVIRNKLPKPLVHLLDGIVFLLILTPFFAVITAIGFEKAWVAYITEEVDTVSTWKPFMWPMYSVMALGLLSMSLQTLVYSIQSFNKVIKGSKK